MTAAHVLRVDFARSGNSRDFVRDGWSAPELRGSWTLGTASRIVLPLPPGLRHGRIRLIASPFTSGDAITSQRLELTANRCLLHAADHTGWINVVIPIPDDALRPSELDIGVFHPGARKPSSTGMSTDNRALAFMFHELVLTGETEIALPDGASGKADTAAGRVVAAAGPRIIKITPMGNMGNLMFQYMFARMLQSRVPDCEVLGYNMPMWGLSRPFTGTVPERALSIRLGHMFDVDDLEHYLRAAPNSFIDFGGLAQRVEYYGSPDVMARMFPANLKDGVPIFGDEFIVINVRAAEILENCHPDYIPVPIGFYRNLLNATSLKPVFMGQIGTDPYSQRLRDAFPDALFVPSRGPAADFEILRNATNLVLSVSTFSWLGGWLSARARTIHMPVLGIFNPQQRIDINLVPRNDPRYSFYRFPVLRWTASAADMGFVLSASPFGEEIKIPHDCPAPTVAALAIY